MNWVSDYVDIAGEDLKELAVKITKSGVNVEKVITNKIDNLVVGQIKKVTKEMDKLSFMLMIYTLLCQNMFDENKKLDFNSRFERLKYLKKILGIFELLNSIEENIDVPYLHEIIKPSHIKKYKKEMH